ncbi:MAG: hypothetical protein ACE14M_03605 [Terriglobales bacterium]
MKRWILCVLALALLASTSLFAENPAASAKSKPAGKKKAANLSTQLQQLQEQLAQQQAQIQQQQSLMQQQQAQIQQLQQQLQQSSQELQASVQHANEQAAAAQQSAKMVNTSVVDLQSSVALQALQQTAQETRKKVEDLEHPTSIRYKGITITPGGFLEASAFARSRNENADTTSNFGALPFGGTSNGNLSEFRFSARNSRISLLGQGNVGSTRLTGYFEMDFAAAAPTANQIIVNAFSPRMRQAFVQADFSNGITVTGGQFWNLMTTNRKGIATRAEFIPNTLEASYVIGYNYGRQTAFRITKNWNNKVWAAFEVGNPETTYISSFVPGTKDSAGRYVNVFGLNNSINASTPNGSTLNYLAGSSYGMSTNLMPDLMAKVAWEPGWGHYELKFLGRAFRDRTNGTGLEGAAAIPTRTNVSLGGGIGAAAVLPVVAKKVDVLLEGMWGAGIGRYGAAGGQLAGPDITLDPLGVPVPIHSFQVMAGIEYHATPKLDLFVYGGDEYYQRRAFLNPIDPTAPAGYGSPLVNNSACYQEMGVTTSNCQAQNKNLWEASAGFWYRFYRGSFGTLQYGAQYEYLYRSTWAGTNGGTVPGFAPKGIENVVYTTFRYFLP